MSEGGRVFQSALSPAGAVMQCEPGQRTAQGEASSKEGPSEMRVNAAGQAHEAALPLAALAHSQLPSGLPHSGMHVQWGAWLVRHEG